MNLHATEMLKIVLIFYLNVASILAVVTTLYENPEIYIEWNIENFFNLSTEIDYCLDSLPFSLANNKWGLQICPNGETAFKSNGYVGVYLKKIDSEGEIRIDYKIGCINRGGFEFGAMEFQDTFNESNFYYGPSKLIKRSTLLSSKDTLVPGGTLTVFCKASTVNIFLIKPQITSSLGTGTLSDNLKDLYTSKRFTDVKLIVDNREFYAHKNVLSSRSTVFGAMLDNISDKVEIKDCDPDSFEEFLLFLYTGKLVDVPARKAMGLYNTAEKHNMQELKKECTQSIVKHNININSFYEILHFANLHSDSVLLKASTDFFITNAKRIISTDKWEKFLSNDPLQGNKLFSSYVENKD